MVITNEPDFSQIPNVEAVKLAEYVGHMSGSSSNNPLDAQLGIALHHTLLPPSEIPKLIIELQQNRNGTA
ncbi:MAG: hypothetical protein V7707_21025 [Motiliproteus sp.]